MHNTLLMGYLRGGEEKSGYWRAWDIVTAGIYSCATGIIRTWKTKNPSPSWKEKLSASEVAWAGFLQSIRKHGLSKQHFRETPLLLERSRQVCPSPKASTFLIFLPSTDCKLFPSVMGEKGLLDTLEITPCPGDCLGADRVHSVASCFVSTTITWLPGHGHAHGSVHECSCL